MIRRSRLLASLLLSASALLAQTAHAEGEYSVRIPIAAETHTPLTQTIDFGNVLVKTSAHRTLTFMNRGAADTTIQSVNLAGRPVALSDNTCLPGKVLKASETCSMRATLTPLSVGAWDASVTIAHSALITPDIFVLRAYGVSAEASLEFNPSLANFSLQPILKWSDPMTIRVTNKGSEAIEVATMKLADNATQFQLSASDCETVIEPGQVCEIEASFGPKYLGAINSRVVVTTAQGTTFHGVSLTGKGVQGMPSFDASTMTFIGVVAGQPTSKPLTLTNIGEGPLLIDSLAVSGDAAFELTSHNCPSSLAAGSSCVINIQVTPPNLDIRSAVLTLTASGTTQRTSRVQVFLQPTAASAVLEVLPTPLAYGTVAVGSSKEMTLTLRSTGNQDVVVSGYSVTGPQGSDFSVVNAQNCTGTLAPGMQCQLQVRTTPTAMGLRNGALNISANTSSPMAPVGLNVQGLQGQLVASPAVLNFPGTQVGNNATLGVTLTNQGGAAVTVSSVKIPTSLGTAVSTTGCVGQSIAPAGTCALTVKFTPATAGTLTGTLELVNTGIDNPTIAVTATGTAAPTPEAVLEAFSCSPNPAQTGATSTCTASLRSTGTAALTVGALSRTGTVFAAPTSNCPASLAPGASCTVTVAATSATAGAQSTTVSVTTGAGVRSSSAATNFQAASVALAPNSHGTVLVGSSNVRTHTLTNTGVFNVTLSSSGSLSAASGLTMGGTPASGTLCANGASLTPGQSCVLTTTCSPTAAGAISSTLSVSTSAGVATGALSCTGEFPIPNGSALTFSPNPVDVGNVPVGTSGARVVTLTNTAPSTVMVSAVNLAGTNAGEFSITANGCIKALAAGTTCQFTVNATPSAAGLRSATINVSANTATAVPAVSAQVTGQRGTLAVTPASATYDAVTVGQSRAASFTVSNTGSASLTVSSVTLGGTDAARYTVTANNCTTLAPAGTCSVSVTFNPTSTAATSATLTVASSTASNGSVSVALSGTAVPAPVAGAALGAFNCAPSPVRTSNTATCTATLNSTGTTALTVGALSRTGTVFAAPTSNCPASLAVGSSCQVSVTLNTATAGTYSTTVSVNTGIGVQSSTAAVSVQAATASLTTASHGTVQVGSSNTRSHVVTNTGAFPITVAVPASLTTATGLTLAGTPTGTACTNGMTLNSGQTCSIATSCSPTAATALSSTLTVSTSAASLTGAVTCTGEYPVPSGSALTVSPSPVNLGDVPVNTTATRVLTLTNTAPSAITISAMSVSGSESADYSLTTNGCLKVLAAGTTCQVTVAGKPSLTGSRAAQLNITANTATTVPAVSLQMNGTLGTLAMSPASQPYGSVAVGSTKALSFTVSNTGTAPLTVSGATLGGTDAARFSVTGNTCSTLAVGATCAVTVTYTPTATVTSAATLTVTASNGSNGSVTSSLSGTGLPAPVITGTAALGSDCATPVQLGGTPSCTVTVTSTGNAPLVLQGYTMTRTGGDFSDTKPSSVSANVGAFSVVSGSASYNSTTGEMTMSPGSVIRMTHGLTGQTATTASISAYRTAAVHTNTLSFKVASGSLPAVALTYNVRAPEIELITSPTSLTLMTYQPNGFYTATVTNKGIGPVKFANAATGTSAPASLTPLSGTPGWLSLPTSASTTCASTTVLNPGQACSVVAQCYPTVAGSTTTGRLNLNTAVAVGANNVLLPQSQTLSCSGIGASATILPATPGMTSVVATGSQSGNWLRFTNTSPVNLTIVKMVADPGFLQYVDSTNPSHCAVNKVIPPQGTCDFMEVVTRLNDTSITATPLVVTGANSYIQTDRATFTYASNYTVTAMTVVPLNDPGTSIQKGDTRDVTLRVTNTTPSAISDIVLDPRPVPGNSVKSHNCTALAPNASCEVTITIAPPLSQAGMTYGASLRVNGRFERIINNVKYPAAVTSSGGVWWVNFTSLTTPSARLTTVPHANTMVNYPTTATHTLTNTGIGPLTVGTVTLTGGNLTLKQNNCPASLAAGTECALVTEFAPTYAGTSTGTLTVATSAGNRTGSIELPSIPQVSVTENCPKVIPLGSAGECTFTLRNESDKPASAAITTRYNQMLCSYGPYYSCSPSSVRLYQYDWGVMGNVACTTGVSPGAISGFGRLSHNCPFNLEPGQSCQVTMPYQANVLKSCLQQSWDYLEVSLSGADGMATTQPGWLSIGGPGIYHQWTLTNIQAHAFRISATPDTSHAKVPFGGTNTLDIPIRVESKFNVNNVRVSAVHNYAGVRTGAPATTAKATDIISVDYTNCSGTMGQYSTCTLRTRCTGNTPGGYKIQWSLSGDVQNGTVSSNDSRSYFTTYCEVDYPPSTAADLTFAAASVSTTARINTSSTFYVQVRNNSGWPITLTNAAFSGANASSYGLFGSCTSVPAFGVCTFTLRFNPTTVGTHSAAFNVWSGLSPTPITIPVTGTASP